MNYGILIISAVIALIIIGMNIIAAYKLQDRQLQGILVFFLLFSATRYITLIIYGDNPPLSLLERLRYFYFASSIGVTMATVLATWYVVPLYREKVSPIRMLLYFLPWQLFYIYVIIKQPTQIIKGIRFGYELALTGKFPLYLSMVQGSFIVVIISLCLIGMVTYKHLQIRVQLIFIIAAQLLLASDGISYSLSGVRVFAPFTITEAFAFASTYYSFAHAVRSIGKKA